MSGWDVFVGSVRLVVDLVALVFIILWRLDVIEVRRKR